MKLRSLFTEEKTWDRSDKEDRHNMSTNIRKVLEKKTNMKLRFVYKEEP
jgi:hypothetical protein